MSGVSISLDNNSNYWPGLGTSNVGGQTINGNDGNDTIDGGAGEDWLIGGIGDDSLIGGDGNDTFTTGAGNDTVYGDDGIDLANYSLSGLPFTVNLSANIKISSSDRDVIFGIENILGGSGNDTIAGDGLDNVLNGGSGDDTLDGGAGNDTLIGRSGTDWASYVTATGAVTVSLGTSSSAGADTNDSLTGIENILTGNGDDSILGDAATNLLNGGAGNDTLLGSTGNDTLMGGSGSDFASYANASGAVDVSINLGTGLGTSSGTEGVDVLVGIEGLFGSAHDDTLFGTGGTLTLYGGDGADSFIPGDTIGGDYLDFGAGDDRFQYLTADLFGNQTLIGGDGNDELNLGVGWNVTAPDTGNDWTNFQRADGTIIYSQGWESIVCFAEGTRIVTPHGEDAVENLRAGDMVLAMRDGQAGFEPLRWVGFMDVAVPRNAAMATKTAPILIKAGAIAPGMPARDLRVSPDHAMEVDGHLIPAKHLVNGSSIIQEVWCKRVRYFHLELEAHGLLLSEGTWSESYLDDDNRHVFNNAALTGLFLDFEAGRSKGEYDHLACLPVLRQGLKLDEIHGRIALRAEELARGAKGRRHG